jgi:mono/diheme cytochrome c family protein
MPARWTSFSAWLPVLLVLVGTTALFAELTADHRKEIAEVRKELGKVQTLTKKSPEAAGKLLDECEKRLDAVVSGADITRMDKAVAPLFKQIEQRRGFLEKQSARSDPKDAKDAVAGKKTAAGGRGSVSFEKDVAPILQARCVTCHGTNRPAAGFSISTFNDIARGSRNGAVFAPRFPQQSPLFLRLSAAGDQRMPKDDQPLSPQEIATIGNWIAAGARFDGTDPDSTIGSSLSDSANANAKTAKKATVKRDVKIEFATGSETVSFTRDVAPFVVNICMRCHAGANPRGGFSVETFEKLMTTGDTSPSITPGVLSESRVWALAGEQQPIKMPPGQLKITKTNHRNLRVWIEEGARFDGKDPTAPLRSLVPTDAEIAARKLAAMTPEQLAELREARTQALWHGAFPRIERKTFETPQFIVAGNVQGDRLKQIGEWLESDLAAVRKAFKDKSDENAKVWRGRLAVFVVNERADYEEFVQSNENREASRDLSGHARVSATQEEAYIIVHDVGDDATGDRPAARVLLYQTLVDAYLQRSPNRLPDWVTTGAGLYFAAKGNARSQYYRTLAAAAPDAVKTMDDYADVFAAGTFSAGDLAAVSYTLVDFLIRSGGEARFIQLVESLQNGTDAPAALQAAYGAPVDQIGWNYVQGLRGSMRGGKR